jgi:sugar phosphate isomerase/epimerase
MFVAVRDLMLPHVPVEPIASLRKLDVGSVDIVVARDMTTPKFPAFEGQPFDLSDENGPAVLANRLREAGLSACCLSLTTDFSREDTSAETEWMARTCAAAGELDVPVVRIDPWQRERSMPADEFLEAAAGAIRDALAGSEAVDLAAENHGEVANAPDFLDRLIERVDSDRFGLALDPGNFYWWGCPLEEVYELTERFAPAARHVHVKNIAYPEERRQRRRPAGWQYAEHSCPVPEGDIDYKRVLAILQDAGYQRALAVEDESLGKVSDENVLNVLKSDVEYLQSIIA